MAGILSRVFVGSKLKLLHRNHLNAGFQRAFYKKGHVRYKGRKQKRVDIEGKLQKPRSQGQSFIDPKTIGIATSETNAIPKLKERSSTWQHSTQRLSSLRTAEKRVAIIAVIVMLVGVIAIKYTVNRGTVHTNSHFTLPRFHTVVTYGKHSFTELPSVPHSTKVQQRENEEPLVVSGVAVLEYELTHG